MSPSDLLDKVKDEKSFLVFAKALLKERREDIELEKQNPSNPYNPSRKGWENTTLEGFLEAAIAWAEDSDFTNTKLSKTSKKKDNSSWKKFADFLYAGKIYE